MNTSEYVSYDLTKHLKEAGFDWKCNAYYHHIIGEEEEDFSETPITDDYNSDEFESPHFSTPTLSQAHKWLREVKGIAINVIAHDAYEKGRAGKYNWKEVYLPNCNENGPQWCDWYIYGHYPLFNTYEEALSDGLSKILKLINYKQEQQ